MKTYYKEAKTVAGIAAYLKKINLDFIDANMPINSSDEVFNFGSWLDTEETHGAPISIIRSCGGFELYATKYTKKDPQRN